MNDYEIKLRLILFRGLVVLAFAFLAFQTWRLQVTRGQEFTLLADQNRFRVLTLDAPRGVIYDRNGTQLVQNRPTYNVVIVPAYLPDDETEQSRIYAQLAEWLEMPITTERSPGDAMVLRQPGPYPGGWLGAPWERPLGDGLGGPGAAAPQGVSDLAGTATLIAPYQPIVIQEDVDAQVANAIEEAKYALPGVFVETSPVRYYPTGSLTAHIVGYMGSIPQGAAEEYEAEGYGPNDQVGLTGLEYEYEALLHSTKGEETVEVDVTGRKIQTVGTSIPAVPGHNLKLTLDLDLQQAMADALAEGVKESPTQSGVAVAVNPQNGQVLAMVSLPGFDNQLFADGISLRDYINLSRDKRHPLVNHAMSGLYSPGSVFKIITAMGALQEGVVDPDTKILAEGVMWLPNKFFPDDPELAQPFYCWYSAGHGYVDVRRALQVSCNIFFYQVSGGYEPTGFQGLGEGMLAYYAQLFGLGNATGIDLPGELDGLVPTPKWKRFNYAETWVTGDTYNMGIGQGFLLATPLQMVSAVAAVGNGGLLYRPYLVEEVYDAEDNLLEKREPQVIRDLLDVIDPANLALVRQGLEAVTAEGGTAEDMSVPGIKVAAKTGTAEYCDSYPSCLDKDGRVKTSHAWFAAYAPVQDPEIAVIVFIYGGGEGSKTAMPVAQSILQYYFDVVPEDETVAVEEDLAADAEAQITGEAPLGATFDSRVIGADGWGEGGAAIHGFVLGREGEPFRGVRVDIVLQGDTVEDEQVVAQVETGDNGQFDFNGVDPTLSERWSVRLTDFPSVPVALDVELGMRYLVEFELE
jgi:penicillin-binding protein 2